MQQFSTKEIGELKSRIEEIHELLASCGDDGAMTKHHADTLGRSQADLSAVTMNHLTFSIQTRLLRKRHFDEMELYGATWDMMLDLMMAERSGRRLSASDLATGAGVPLSSGLRMIAALENAGLARRFLDERDRRRSLVRMTDTGREKMLSYFEKTEMVWRNSQRAA